MFGLKTASLTIRKIAAQSGIKSGQYEPINADRSIDSLANEDVVVRIYNRNHPDGITITAGDIRYAQQYS